MKIKIMTDAVAGRRTNSALPRIQAPPTLLAVNPKKPLPASDAAPEACAHPAICPLNQVKAGTVVCVRELATSPEISDRLREMGLREDSHVRLVSRQDSVICLVCNARVALSQKLAESILVEPVTP